MNSRPSAKAMPVRANPPHAAGRRGRLIPGGLALVVVLALVTGCKTDRDPRTGGFFDGVNNLASGGYDDFVQEKRNELHATQTEATVLQARANAIQAERDALDRELSLMVLDLERLEERLAARRLELDQTTEDTALERQKLAEVEERIRQAQARYTAVRQAPAASVATARQDVDDLKHLIGTIGTMVDALSST